MGRRIVTLLVLLCVVATSLPAQAQIITKVERRNPDADSGDTEPAIAPSPLGEKSPCFVDRTHVWVTVPEILLGAQYIMTANDDKNNANHELDVTLSKATIMYLFIDNRVGTGTGNSPTTNPDLVAGAMTWVTTLGFVDTGINMAIDESNDGSINQWLSIYSLSVPAGKITLKGQNNAYNMYGVAVGGEPVVKATKPSPADMEEGLTMPLFTWKAGAGAIVHNVYLGTSADLGAADLVGPRNVGTMFFYGLGLIPGQTYYWRVDEIEADMVTVHTGDVWSFVTASMTAWKPSPQDGFKWIDPNTTLDWKAGKNAFSHDVYFGTDKAAVESGDAGAFRENTFFATWKPAGLLAPDTTYYWRVDELAPDGKKEVGQVWSFTTIPAIEITDPDLLAWYKMDEGGGMTAVDWSGHGHHATFASPAPVWAVGQFGGALQFAGNGESAICADGGFLNGLDALTVAVWIKSDVTNTDRGYINFMTPNGNDDRDMRYDAAGSTGGGTIVQKMGLTVAAADGTSTVVQLESSNNSQTTEWQHVTLVWSSGQALQFYINGNLDAPTTSSAPATGTLVGHTTVVIGKGGKDNSGTSSWDGLIDEIRIYSKALTQDELQLVMRGDVMLAWDPHPGNGANTDELKAMPMTWQAGEKASQHDVYFGMDRAVIAAATPSDATGTYRGRQKATSFSPTEQLEWGKQYFWRVDEVNSDGTISQGFVWAFTLANYLIVDEFETYSNSSPNRVFQTWIDGLGFSEDEFFPKGNPGNGTGAMVGYDPLAGNIMETSIVHGGKYSMPVEYNNVNSPYYSEVDQTWDTAQNWKLGGVTDLSLWFQGYPEGFIQSATGITMNSAGTDIWNTADQFRFAFKRLTGDGWIIAKVESVGNTDVWAKAGVMIRGTLDAGSRFAYNIVSAASGASFGRREMTDTAATSAPATTGIVAPYWVKLTRTGDVLKAEISADGKTWTPATADATASSATVTMAGNIYIGLCVTSHNSNAKIVTTGVFSNISTSANVTGQWQMAEIGIDSPENSAQDLYVVLQDSAGKNATVTYPNGSNVAAWTEWKIPLSQFTGVNMGAVKKMSIGLGNRKSPKPDGAGMMFFDDIRVLKPTP
jgi:hypothetical protein